MTARPTTVLAWSLFGISLLLSATSITLGVTEPTGDPVFTIATALVLALPFPALGALIASRRPRNAIGWILSAIGLFQAVNIWSSEWARWALLNEPEPLPLGGLAARVAFWSWMPSIGLLVTFLLLLFPDGRLPSPRWRWAAWLAGAGLVLTVGGSVVGAWSIPPIEFLVTEGDPTGFPRAALVAAALGGILVGAGALASATSLIVRFRRARGVERLQIKWMAYAGGFLFVAAVAQFTPLAEAPGWIGFATLASFLVGIVAIPTAASIAILKHGLFAIDVVVNKAVVYGALAVFATLVYLVIVSGVGTVIGTAGTTNQVLPVVATAIVALAFQPARAWARRLANRIVYGERATPYEVLSDFSERIAAAYSTEDVMPRMAQLAASSTGATSSRIWLRVGQELRPTAGWPDSPAPVAAVPVVGDELSALPGADRSFPVEHRGELLGAVSLVVSPADPLTPSQEKLVGELARQAGLVLRNVRLLEEVRASRQRLVSAQDEERRRLERNIHDGAQQQLVALQVKQRLAEALVDRDPAKARELLEEIQRETASALDDLRDLARGIYPPLLADQGLGAALESQARKSPVPVTVNTDGIGRYPAETEAAVYFSCLEALQNVAKYAEATRATVRLAQSNGALTFEVEDDGRGFDPAVVAHGTGLQGIADRLAALGGELDIRSAPGDGTTVAGRLPVPTEVPSSGDQDDRPEGGRPTAEAMP